MAQEVVATLTDLYRFRVGPGFVGHSVYVTAEGAFYEALFEGEGPSIWQARVVSGQSTLLAGVQGISRTFSIDDPDVAVSAPTVAIDMGDPLPTGAVVLATIGVVSEIFGGGGAVAVTADVGRAIEDDDLFTPTPINLHAGAVVTYPQFNGFPAGGYQVAVTINADVDLDTLTDGELTVTVLYCIPTITTIAAPSE